MAILLVHADAIRRLSGVFLPTVSGLVLGAIKGYYILLIVGGKGYVSAACPGLSLGFVNQIGNRANSLYSPEWRICCLG
jgi:hypothetical protein